MLLATVLLSAALAPQAPAEEIETPFDTGVAEEPVRPPGFETDPTPTPISGPTATEAAPPATEAAPPATEVAPLATEVAPPATEVAPPAADVVPPATGVVPPASEAASPLAEAATTGDPQVYIDTGLKAFIRGRFSTAREAFQQAYDADPQSAAAAFYLGYAHYKLGEPSRRMDSNKQMARELFAEAYRIDPMFQPVWGRPQ